MELFQHLFEFLGEDLLRVVEESTITDNIHQPFNFTFLALIPKKEDPKYFEDFRPISLCAFIYKFIAKVIATRINHFLSKNISMEQFGFLDGMKIHEEVRVAEETLHSLKISKKKGAIVKIDLSKAYDQIS